MKPQSLAAAEKACNGLRQPFRHPPHPGAIKEPGKSVAGKRGAQAQQPRAQAQQPGAKAQQPGQEAIPHEYEPIPGVDVASPRLAEPAPCVAEPSPRVAEPAPRVSRRWISPVFGRPRDAARLGRVDASRCKPSRPPPVDGACVSGPKGRETLARG